MFARQRGDALHLHRGAELDFVARDCRSAGEAGDHGVDLELIEHRSEGFDDDVVGLAARAVRRAFLQHDHRRQRVDTFAPGQRQLFAARRNGRGRWNGACGCASAGASTNGTGGTAGWLSPSGRQHRCLHRGPCALATARRSAQRVSLAVPPSPSPSSSPSSSAPRRPPRRPLPSVTVAASAAATRGSSARVPAPHATAYR